MTEKFKCSRDKNGLNYIDVFIVKDDKEYIFKTLVKTGSDYTIFSAKELNVDISNLKKIKAVVGYEEIDVYEVVVNEIAIGDKYDGSIYCVDHIYVSDLDYFKDSPVLGMDYLSKMNISSSPEEGMILEFDGGEVGNELTEERRTAYLQNLDREQIKFSLTDFFFIEDGMYPSEFELVLVIDKHGELSAGCVDNGGYYHKEHPRGVIHQSRGGVIFFEDIIAWKPIDGVKVL